MDELPERLSIRPATPDDVEWCSRRDYASAERLIAAIAQGRVWVACRGGRIVGMLRGTWLHDAAPMLALVYVDAPARGAGIARSLLSRWRSELVRDGHAFCLSSSTDGEAHPALWHRRCGFERCGTIEGLNDDGADELLFRLDFDRSDHPATDPQRQGSHESGAPPICTGKWRTTT